VIRDLETGQEHAIAFDEEAYALGSIRGSNSTPTGCASPIPP